MAFKTSFRGYSKESVNEYIVAANLERAREAADLKAEIDEMCAIADAAKEDARAANLRAQTAEEEKKKSALEADKIKAERDRIATERDRVVSERDDVTAARDLALDEIARLESELDALAAKLKEAELRAELLDAELEAAKNNEQANGARASAILNDAMTVSENLIASARREANEIKRQAEVELELARDSVRKSAIAAMRDINKMIDTAAEQASAEISATAREAEDAAVRMNGEITQKSNRIANKVSHIRSVLDADVENRIAQMSLDEDVVSKHFSDVKNTDTAVLHTPKPAKPNRCPVHSQQKKGFNLASVFGLKK
jgi:cell division septum initiation protein DivIVA